MATLPDIGVVFYAAPVITASALATGSAFRHGWPLRVQPPVKFTPATAVIDDFRMFGIVGHEMLIIFKFK
jgi:hypothetical protein